MQERLCAGHASGVGPRINNEGDPRRRRETYVRHIHCGLNACIVHVPPAPERSNARPCLARVCVAQPRRCTACSHLTGQKARI
jgi:hypothetical protein